MKKIAVISSKGGVGKTTLSIALAEYFAKNGYETTLVDGDVNAPNIGKWFEIEEWDYKKDITIFPLPNRFLKCKEIKILCDGEEYPLELEKRGEVRVKKRFKPEGSDYAFNIISGEIFKGHTGSGKVVEATLNHRIEGIEEDVRIFDTAPGTGYPVLAAIERADYVIIITEATKLGLTDFLKLRDIVEEKEKKYGVVVNRADLGKDIVEEIKRIAGENYLGEISTSEEIKNSMDKRLPPLTEEVTRIAEKVKSIVF